MRKHYSDQEKLDAVQLFKSSGLSLKEFSSQNAINYHTLRSWCLSEEELKAANLDCGTNQVGFVEVKTSYFRQQTKTTQNIIVKKAGIEINLPMDTSLSEMKTVLEALSAL